MKKIPQQEIYAKLSCLEGTVGLYIEVLDTGEIFEINPDHVFPSASVIKIPMLALLLRDVKRAGRTGTPPVKSQRPTAWAAPGFSANLIRAMAYACDTCQADDRSQRQPATNEIMDIIGIERHNAFCREMGFEHITLMRKMLDFDAIKQAATTTCARAKQEGCFPPSQKASLSARKFPTPSCELWKSSSAATNCLRCCPQLQAMQRNPTNVTSNRIRCSSQTNRRLVQHSTRRRHLYASGRTPLYHRDFHRGPFQ
jgi:hypothetical protein